MANVTKGADLMLFLQSESGSDVTYHSIAFATSHTLEISQETKETTSKDSGGVWQTSEPGTISWTVSTENLYSTDGSGDKYGNLFSLMTEQKKVKLYFANKTESVASVPNDGWTPDKAKDYFSGEAIITSLSLNAQNGENATFSAQFQGVGELTKGTTN